jgi:hypothetical protein
MSVLVLEITGDDVAGALRELSKAISDNPGLDSAFGGFGHETHVRLVRLADNTTISSAITKLMLSRAERAANNPEVLSNYGSIDTTTLEEGK